MVENELNPRRIAEKYLLAYEATVKKSRQALAQESWLRLACGPSTKQVGALTFLDHLPLKDLMRYVWQRSKKKLSP
jgi:hypothetical protein